MVTILERDARCDSFSPSTSFASLRLGSADPRANATASGSATSEVLSRWALVPLPGSLPCPHHPHSMAVNPAVSTCCC